MVNANVPITEVAWLVLLHLSTQLTTLESKGDEESPSSAVEQLAGCAGNQESAGLATSTIGTFTMMTDVRNVPAAVTSKCTGQLGLGEGWISLTPVGIRI